MMVHSFGIVPLRKIASSNWEALLVQQRRGLHWSFPKGHAEKGESPQQTATRELMEETGLAIKQLLLPFPFTEKYTFVSDGVKIDKTVSYFIAEVTGEIQIQTEELLASKWVPLAFASDYISFPEARKLSRDVFQALQEEEFKK